jgi:hypothetical protein
MVGASMLRNRIIGSEGSASRTASAIAGRSVAAGSALRNMMCMPSFPQSPSVSESSGILRVPE